mgnify:CR=1 FL=1
MVRKSNWPDIRPQGLIRIQGGEEIPVKKGDFWRTPGGVEHTVIGGENGAVILDVFSPPRDEYRKPGSGFGTG